MPNKKQKISIFIFSLVMSSIITSFFYIASKSLNLMDAYLLSAAIVFTIVVVIINVIHRIDFAKNNG